MASNDYGVLFPTSVVGSVPRPDFVRDLISDDAISPAEYDRRMEAAVRYVVAMQENAGLDILTDGEGWRKSYIGVIADLAHGVELGTNPADGRPWTIVVDGLCNKPATYNLEDCIKPYALEERLYRVRCVGAWSFVIPWVGLPLSEFG